jgi:hypothetical protein
MDDFVRRAREDLVFRRRLVANLEQAFLEEGLEPRRALVEALRRRLASN